jgi:D-sedoheptulose 7-phosphate isomerase
VKTEIRDCLLDSSKTLAAMAEKADEIERFASLVIDCLKKGGKVLAFGNGGSAADSQHFCDELVGRYERNRPPLAALALTVNTSDLTSIGNDFGFEHIFERQVDAHGRKGDVAVAISTIGNSPNVLAAIKAARERGITVVGLTGSTGGKMRSQVDLCLCVPSTVVARIQESHIAVLQTVCGLVEQAMFPGSQKAH